MRDLFRRKSLVAIVLVPLIVLFLLIFSNLSTPLKLMDFPKQQLFEIDPRAQEAITRLAAKWGSSKSNFVVFAVRVDPTFGEKEVAVVETETLSSAIVWIPGSREQLRQLKHVPLQLTDGSYLLSEYIPKNWLEKAIAHNFYANSGWARSYNATIAYIRPGFPFGEIGVTSFELNLMVIPVLVTYPLFQQAVHVDVY